MEPLKRFTQCGSLTMLFAVFIVLFGVSSTALTTFGKSPNLPPPPPTPGTGRYSNPKKKKNLNLPNTRLGTFIIVTNIILFVLRIHIQR